MTEVGYNHISCHVCYRISCHKMDDSERGRSRLDQVLGFCADTTAHGLGPVAAAKSWLVRLFWLVIFGAAFSYSMFEIYQSIKAYRSYPTRTDISIVNKEQLRFPAVTVCNINPFKQSKLKNSPLRQKMVSIFFLFCVLQWIICS